MVQGRIVSYLLSYLLIVSGGGLRRGVNFWLRLTTASAQCLCLLSERFFWLEDIFLLYVASLVYLAV